jgi:ATP-binding cassette subfamily B protein
VLGTATRILRFWKPHRALGWGLVVAMVLRAVFSVVLALAIKFVIDRVIDPSSGTSAWVVAGLLVGGFAVSVGAGFVAARLTARASADIIADVRTEAFDHLQHLSMGFHDRSATGDLIAHFSSDIAQLSTGVIRKPLIGLRAVTAMALYLPVMLFLDLRLATLALVVIPTVVYAVYRMAPESAVALDEEKQRIADVLDEVSGNLGAQRVIRANVLSGRSRRRFTERVSALRDASEKAESRIAYEAVIAEYGVELAKLVIVAVGAALAFAGELDPGSFAAFAAILTEFAYQASVFGMDVLPSIKQSEAGIRRIDALLDVEASVWHTGSAAAPSMSAAIEFRDVVFRYRRDQPATLDGISLTIPEQSYVAVVGPNGSGKSSLLNVVLGLYPIESGRVTVGGVDLASLAIDGVRRRIGVAFQDTFLFDGSLRENVTLGAPTTDEDLERALRSSGLWHLVDRLPDGVETVVGPGGLVVSTGEAQRVAVARAVLRDPDLLLLDEVASGLDPESEAELLESVEGLRPGRTILSITHRLESVKTADLIVVVDAGRVVESGRFEQLLAAGGAFGSMWTKQHGFDVSANGLSARIHAHRLREIPIFTGLSDAVLGDLAGAFTSHSYRDGDMVIRQGERGDAFYVIARGIAEVVRDTDGPDERVIARLEDGDFFGEMALLSSGRRNASVRARGSTTVLRLDRRSFGQLMATVPEAREIVEQMAASRAADNAAVLGLT